MYHIIDRHTGRRVRTTPTLRAAIRAVDRLDNEYGGYRYYYQAAQIGGAL